MSAKPFALDQYDLGEGARLDELSPERARLAAVRLAGSDPWRSLGYTPAGLERYLATPDPALRRYSVEREGEAAGVVCVRWPWLKGPYLELLGLYPGQRGGGVGRRIMGWFEEEGAKGGANAWVLVSSFNEGARRFYARLGYTEVGELPDLAAEGFTELLLRKKLNPA